MFNSLFKPPVICEMMIHRSNTVDKSENKEQHDTATLNVTYSKYKLQYVKSDI